MCGRIMTGSVWRSAAFTKLTALAVVVLLHCKVRRPVVLAGFAGNS
jgi:hypothetical protein